VWHALVSGAEAVIFFRWRACLDAQEQYHTGLLRHDGSPDVGYGDLETLQAEGARLRAFAGQPMASPHVALIFDYEDLWALNHQPHHSNFNYLRYYFVFYRALQRLSIPVDIRPQNADLSPYRLVITPTSHLTNPALVESLTEFAHKGGSVLLGIRTGLKTPTNRVVDAPLPGVYRDLIGATVTQWHALPPSVLYDLQTDIPGVAGPATTWAEALATDPDTEIFARYSSGPLEGSAALVKKDVGKGRVWYLGWYPAFSQMLSLITHLANLQNIPYFANLPPGVILYPRGPFLAALNFTDTSQSIVILGRKIAIGPRSVQIVQTE
jgi:beta-galactosidase